MSKQHPLIEAIELKRKAIRNKCHPLFVKEIEKTIKLRAAKSVSILEKTKFGRQLLKD